MSQVWQLSIRFDSDWHCGTGTGSARGADRAVARDRNDLPFVPGRTLKGMWRDACERAAHGLDEGTPGPWTDLVAQLFGSAPGAVRDASLVSVGSAHLPADWQAALGVADDTQAPLRRFYRRALVNTRFAVSIDGRTGTARDDMLREIETARAGLHLIADCTVDVPLSHWETELILLSGLRLLQHIGAHRRRGLGRCTVQRAVNGANQDSWLVELLDRHAVDLARPRPLPAAAPTVATPTAAPTARGDMRRRATITLTTRSTVVAARLVLGNTVLSHDHIPAASLMPWVAQALGRPDFPTWIRDGHIVITDANPCILAGTRHVRADRVPLSVCSSGKGSGWRRQRGDVTDVLDPAAATPTADMKPVGGWAVPITQGLRRGEPVLTTRAHAVIDDETQRPGGPTGDGQDGLFVYQGIGADSVLAFEIWHDGVLDNVDLSGLTGPARLGRSRLVEYGQVDSVLTDPDPQPTPGDTTDQFVLTLTSDMALVDQDGLWSPSVTVLAAHLQTAVAALPGHARTRLSILDHRVQVVRRDSWAASLQLPRATIMALAAGSIVRFATDAPIDLGPLQTRLDHGVGERHTEGFGRCRVAPASWAGARAVVAAQAAHLRPPRPGTSGPDDLDGEAWATVRQSAWQDALTGLARDAADTPNVRERLLAPGLSPSQLGSLREATLAGPDAVLRWVAATSTHDKKSRAWSATRLHLIGSLAAHAVAAQAGPADGDGAAEAPVAGFAEQVMGLLPGCEPPIPPDLGGLPAGQVLQTVLLEFLHRANLQVQGADRPAAGRR